MEDNAIEDVPKRAVSKRKKTAEKKSAASKPLKKADKADDDLMKLFKEFKKNYDIIIMNPGICISEIF